MKTPLMLGVMLAATTCLAAPLPTAQTPPPKAKQTLYYIPHTHWEGAVFSTREEYLQMGLPHILQALELLKKYPEYKFTLDQVAYFKPFLERYPEEAASFRKFVKEGRLELVGGMDVMPDVVKPGGELFVRQMMYGKRWCREQLGVDVKAAWLVDTFGFHPQMPQLLKQAGYTSFWFCRGVPNNRMPSEFFWKGIDGSQIPAFWIPGFYGLFWGPPRDIAGFSKFFEGRFNSLNAHAKGSERVGLAGVDVSEPEEHVAPLIEQFNRRADAPFDIRFSVPSDFAAVVAKRKETPVIEGDFNPIFQGTYSSRPELKQTTREIEQKLLTAEKLGALSNWLGVSTNDAELWRTWEPLLFNQTHDLASGVMTDHVYADTVKSYDFSARLADEMIEARWSTLTKSIDTRGEGTPVVVFNPLGSSRTDYAETEIGFAQRGVKGVEVLDASGKSIAVQVEPMERYSDGGIRRARIGFVSQNVPALGYATFHVKPLTAASDVATTTGSADTIENEFYRVRFDVKTGAILSLYDKARGWDALSGPANVVSQQVDKGDLWEPYHTLDGASYIAMTNKQPVPTAANAILSTGFSGKDGTIQRGPVFSEFRVSHPLGTGVFTTRVRLYNGIPRVDIRTELVNNEKFVRYQVQFPTAVKSGRSVQEIPFGAVERPVGVEYPAQQWVDYSADNHGVALLNVGLPGNLVSDDTLILSLMRSQTLGDYNEGHPSDSGFELGMPRVFRYALVPHTGGFREVEAYRQGLEFNHPLVVRKVEAHAGVLPARWGMAEISQPNIVLTTFKPGPRNAVALRVYEAAGRAAQGVTIKLSAEVTSANEANLLEDEGRKLTVRENTLKLDFHPYEIKTILLKLRPAAKSRTVNH